MAVPENALILRSGVVWVPKRKEVTGAWLPVTAQYYPQYQRFNSRRDEAAWRIRTKMLFARTYNRIVSIGTSRVQLMQGMGDML